MSSRDLPGLPRAPVLVHVFGPADTVAYTGQNDWNSLQARSGRQAPMHGAGLRCRGGAVGAGGQLDESTRRVASSRQEPRLSFTLPLQGRVRKTNANRKPHANIFNQTIFLRRHFTHTSLRRAADIGSTGASSRAPNGRSAETRRRQTGSRRTRRSTSPNRGACRPSRRRGVPQRHEL
jgi:hypothetical protein